ncbi:hypothetical protein EYF80_053013 [Liparis tanakae]|uniref:Uncharacterized protein n=1 Tax=Liparis tanakae TaxID=230148 RepID=A0A4Z2F924_9TELE|nr:hypothetical protein EYF80_053013 [Liparis tanakae]
MQSMVYDPAADHEEAASGRYPGSRKNQPLVTDGGPRRMGARERRRRTNHRPAGAGLVSIRASEEEVFLAAILDVRSDCLSEKN